MGARESSAGQGRSRNGKGADALETGEAHEAEQAAAFKKEIVAFPTEVDNKKDKDLGALSNRPFLAHQRQRRRRGPTTGGGTTEGLPTDVT